jgi:hypothetical protein
VAGASVTHDRRTFGTTTADLEALREWLTAHSCTQTADEDRASGHLFPHERHREHASHASRILEHP